MLPTPSLVKEGEAVPSCHREAAGTGDSYPWKIKESIEKCAICMLELPAFSVIDLRRCISDIKKNHLSFGN